MPAVYLVPVWVKTAPEEGAEMLNMQAVKICRYSVLVDASRE